MPDEQRSLTWFPIMSRLSPWKTSRKPIHAFLHACVHPFIHSVPAAVTCSQPKAVLLIPNTPSLRGLYCYNTFYFCPHSLNTLFKCYLELILLTQEDHAKPLEPEAGSTGSRLSRVKGEKWPRGVRGHAGTPDAVPVLNNMAWTQMISAKEGKLAVSALIRRGCGSRGNRLGRPPAWTARWRSYLCAPRGTFCSLHPRGALCVGHGSSFSRWLGKQKKKKERKKMSLTVSFPVRPRTQNFKKTAETVSLRQKMMVVVSSRKVGPVPGCGNCAE